VAEFISEKEALDNLVSYGMLTRGIADIIQKVARDKVFPIIESQDSPDCRVLVLLIDKSASMNHARKAVIEMQHHLLNSILYAPSMMMIYLGQVLFNDKTEYFQELLPFRASEHHAYEGTRWLDDNNYQLGGQTALYDAILSGIAMVSTFLDKAESLGQQPFVHVAVISDGKDHVVEDGQDIGSRTRPDSLKKVIDYMLTAGIIHRITFVGIGDRDYRAIGNSIGINNVIEADVEPRKIRKAFDMNAVEYASGLGSVLRTSKGAYRG
jgi:hypothetical protein